jgi:probable phosphoglycerate mutase
LTAASPYETGGHALVRNIYVITHPEATHHVDRVVGGWHDSQLTPAGIRAAVSIAEALRAGIPDDAEVDVITSDLRRARRTADETAKSFGVQPIEDRRLRERSLSQPPGHQPRRHRPSQFMNSGVLKIFIHRS